MVERKVRRTRASTLDLFAPQPPRPNDGFTFASALNLWASQSHSTLHQYKPTAPTCTAILMLLTSPVAHHSPRRSQSDFAHRHTHTHTRHSIRTSTSRLVASSLHMHSSATAWSAGEDIRCSSRMCIRQGKSLAGRHLRGMRQGALASERAEQGAGQDCIRE